MRPTGWRRWCSAVEPPPRMPFGRGRSKPRASCDSCGATPGRCARGSSPSSATGDARPRRGIGRSGWRRPESTSPALSARVRSALSERAPARPGPFWIAGLAAALIAAIVIGVFVVSNFNRHLTSGVPGGLPRPSPSASPTANQTPPDSNLPAFSCNSFTAFVTKTTSPPQPPIAFIDLVRTGTHSGYDRITIEFQNGDPSKVDVTTQNNATFTQGASGQSVTLAGSAGLLIVIHGADEHTAYSGPIDFETNYPVLLEARQMEDFEGTVQWGLGLSKSACYRVFFLTNPTRLA